MNFIYGWECNSQRSLNVIRIDVCVRACLCVFVVENSIGMMEDYMGAFIARNGSLNV